MDATGVQHLFQCEGACAQKQKDLFEYLPVHLPTRRSRPRYSIITYCNLRCMVCSGHCTTQRAFLCSPSGFPVSFNSSMQALAPVCASFLSFMHSVLSGLCETANCSSYTGASATVLGKNPNINLYGFHMLEIPSLILSQLTGKFIADAFKSGKLIHM